MPQIVGQGVDKTGSIAESLRNIGENMYRPIDPVSQEKIKQLRAQSAARTNMIAALQRGDLIE